MDQSGSSGTDDLTCTYTQTTANANGTPFDTFTYKVSDDELDSETNATVTINLTAVADAPTLTTITTLATATEDTAFNITYAALAAAADEADADGDTLEFRVEAVSTGTLTKSAVAVIPGTSTLATGETWVWTPASNANGTLNAFTVKAYDGTTASSTAIQVQVTTTAVNDGPTIGNLTNYVFPMDGAAVPISQGSTFTSPTPSFSDVDGDTVAAGTWTCTYETPGMDSSDINYVATATNCTSLPSLQTTNSTITVGTINDGTADAFFSTSTGVLVWTPTLSQRGTYKINLSVDDSSGATGTSSYYITVRENVSSTNLLLGLDAMFSRADSNLSGIASAARVNASANDVVTDSWLDISSNTSDIALSTFSTSAPWAGTGATGAPYELAFDGANDELNLGTPLVDAGADRMGFSMWVKPGDVTDTSSVLLSSGGGTGDGILVRQDTANPDNIEFMVGNTAGCEASDGLSNGEWNHVAGIFDGTNTQVYINGSQSCTAANGTLNSGATNLYLGSTATPGDWWQGSIGDFKIYGASGSTPLSASNIADIFLYEGNRYRATPVENVVTDNLLLHLDAANYEGGMRFGGTGVTNTTWYDMSGNGAHATLSNFNTPATYGWQGDGTSGDPYRLVATNDDMAVSTVDGTSLNELTIEFWVNPISLPGAARSMIAWAQSAGSGTPFAFITYSGSIIRFFVDNGYRDTAQAMTAGNWHHLALTLSTGNVWTLYLNGTSIGTYVDDATHNLQANADYIYNGGSYGTDMQASKPIVRVYSDELTLQEIRQNCHAQKDRFSGATCAGP